MITLQIEINSFEELNGGEGGGLSWKGVSNLNF